MNADEILSQLDQCNAEYTFPMLDNGYVYPAGTKLTVYRDEKRWVLIIEVIGFSYRGGGHNGITNCLHVYGNCLSFQPGIRNENFIYLTANASDCETFDNEEFFYLNPCCSHFNLRDEMLPVVHNRDVYLANNIIPEDNERINAFEFLRMLDKLYHVKLVATEDEIRNRIPADIPVILELHEWYHPDVVRGEIPSRNETFKQISKVLETGIVEFYKQTKMPNTHWSNWPDGGTL